MIRLYRRGVNPPANWKQRVNDALPNAAKFRQKAAQFEKLPINSPQRRKRFSKFAPSVLRLRGGKREFPPLWGEAKEPLKKMSHQKCAYCESMIDRRRSGQVEHFKPKALFPTLAYDWSNYFLACGGCNGPKGDKWPENGEYVRPDQGDPSRLFQFEKSGKMNPVGSLDAENTWRDFGLNEEWLVEARRNAIAVVLDDLEDLLRLPGSDGVLARKLRRLQQPTTVYSAALTQCFVRAWQAARPDAPL